MAGIFKNNAPLYWEAGIPVMPLKRWDSPGKGAGKAPILSEWTQYGDVMPTEAMRGHWLATYPDSNIGLPFGPASNLCAIDIDTDDEALIAAIKSALPDSPWTRVGKKGMGLIFRWQGQPNFKLRNNENESIVEFLGKGNQMVMPPSIHPDTGRPYVSDTNLYEVLSHIQLLPMDVEQQLRNALEPILGTKGFTLAQTGRSAPLDVVPQGERDIQLVRHAGYLARVVLGIDKRFKLTLKQAMEQMSTWVTDFTAGAAGDDMDPDKGVAKLLEFLLKDIENGGTFPSGWDDGLTTEQLEHPTIAAMVEKNQVQRWTTVKVKSFISDVIDPVADDPDKVMEKVQHLLAEIAKDDNFGKLEFNSVVKDIQDALTRSELKLTKPDLTKAFKEAKAGDQTEDEDHEAIARAAVTRMERGGELRFDMGQPWQWSGSCFNPLDERDIYMDIAENVKGNQLARRHNDYQAITKTVLNIIRAPLVQELEIGINFANGFLDSNLKLHDHSPKYGKTFTMPFNYIPERADEAHKFLEFLEQSWGDDPDYADKVNALQEAMAATMFGLGPQYQRAILLHGKPKTGKSQLLEIVQAMMPANARSAIPPNDWSEGFAMVGMIGKTLNVAGELPEESVIGGAKFKMVVAGEEITDSFKGKDRFKFRPIATHWFASNFLPRSRDTSGGFVRRWLVLDFNRIVPDNERVPDFWRILIAEEREAIAAWAVKGLIRLQKSGEYTQPESHTMRLAQVLRGNNSVAAFLSWTDKVKIEDGAEADARSVFDQYVFYMKDISKGWSVSFERFTQMLGDLGHECVTYKDALDVQRLKARGLRMIGPQLPG